MRFWWVSLALWLLVAPTTAAQESPPNEYDAVIDDAIREFDAHNYEEARVLFARAHKLFPNARTHRGLGFVEFELRNYGACIEELESALASTVKPLDERLRRDTERVLARARDFVGQLHLASEPPASLVLVDDAVVKIPEGRALVLRVGDHVVELRTEGYAPERRRLSLKGGEERTLRVVFAKPNEAVGAHNPASHSGATGKDRSPEKRWYKSPWLWTALGVLAVGAAGTSFALLRSPSGDPADLPDRRIVTQ